MRFFLLAIALPTLAGCQSAYCSAMEKVGLHKRDILVNRVEAARDSQQEAKEVARAPQRARRGAPFISTAISTTVDAR